MSVDFEFKDKYNVYDLISIVKVLRAPGGCPWDREQTHSSIKKNFIEETYEVIEAINKNNPDMLKEELGDVLLQVALHAEMERESGNFDFDDIANDIVKKLIIRHPHVFGDVSAQTEEEALSSWDNAKAKSKGMKSQSESMLSVPRELPALMRAQKIQQKAAKVGFDWDNINGAFDKLNEEINELKIAMAHGVKSEIEDEFGDVLFSCVNISRFLKTDSEEALTLATDKFLERFTEVEKLANEIGINMKESSIEELDALWDKAKKIKIRD
ncbi:MAG: nucleoside triphosphate pyrophosphohydrolase [Eubacterium sp.]|nr:nucleoside triphosphate pyrophosphohydrolase [Eubacterium sp.]